jgi:hypothetical protein
MTEPQKITENPQQNQKAKESPSTLENDKSYYKAGVDVWVLNLQTSRQTSSPTGARDVGILA